MGVVCLEGEIPPVTRLKKVSPRCGTLFGLLPMNFGRKPEIETRPWILFLEEAWAWKGPVQVLLTTTTSLKVEGRTEWVHALRCRQAPSSIHVEGKSCGSSSSSSC